jgi:hypothetical protein
VLEGSAGEGIQAVGVNTWVSNNYVSDAEAEYIEVRSTSMHIDSNTLYDTQGIMQGIVINCNSPVNPATRYSASTIDHNNITGCLNAILVVGSNAPSVNITNNTITNPFAAGISVQSNAPSYKVTASRNTINITTPNKGSRKAITSYAGALTSSQLFTATSNIINYKASAGGGTSAEYAFVPNTNNAIISGNVVNTSSIVSGNTNVVGISSNGGTFTGCYIGYNTINGDFVTFMNGFISATLAGNNF